MFMEPVCLVGAGVVIPGCEGIEDLWRRAQDGPPVFGFPDKSRGYEALSSADPDAPGRAYDLRFGEVPATSATGSTNGQSSIERGDLQTEANHELDVALAADMVLDGIVERLPAGRAEARNKIRQLLPEADPCVASPHGKFSLYKETKRAVQGILPEGTPKLVVDDICQSGLCTFPATVGERPLAGPYPTGTVPVENARFPRIERISITWPQLQSLMGNISLPMPMPRRRNG
ncbi:hypothetical protein [Saccharopolyspora spinosa]|uniref:hypothetical protein n=1 Tax=Saccharopolyspora spinosa TaxID=60894 RepID=UPI00117A7001|nr:hypothetical protein [Saccharopolyspora spinosa]